MNRPLLFALASVAALSGTQVEAAIGIESHKTISAPHNTEVLVAGRKFTSANVDKIKEGMTLAEVEAILGKGRKQSTINLGGMVAVEYMWGRMMINRYVDIQFVDGKANLIMRVGI